jgi:D-alanyl-D-alanine carboxypeptidase
MNMTTAELAELARRNRGFKEAGAALVISSAILFVFLFIPLSKEHAKSVASTATTTPETPFITAPIEAEAAIVYDLVTGKVLFEKNASAQLPLASLTKLLTVYAALATLPPDTPIAVSAEAAGAEAPHAFSHGTTFTLADIARLTLTASLNDGAAAIAQAAAQKERLSTMQMLAAAASSLDLKETYALNGSGLDLSEAVSGGYGSARDIARLAGALVAAAPDVAFATTEASVEARSVSGKVYRVENTDPFTAEIPRLLLSKTGYTDLANGNLALVFDAGLAHPIAVVVLGSSKEARFSDGLALISATLAHFAGVPSL